MLAEIGEAQGAAVGPVIPAQVERGAVGVRVLHRLHGNVIDGQIRKHRLVGAVGSIFPCDGDHHPPRGLGIKVSVVVALSVQVLPSVPIPRTRIQQIVACTAVRGVATLPAAQLVIPGISEEPVLSPTTENKVVAAETRDGVVRAEAGQHVVALRRH